MIKKHVTLAFAMLVAGAVGAGSSVAEASAESQGRARSAPTSAYAVDFVASAATGIDMNDAGDVVGRSRLDPGCGSTCLPPEETVVWRGSKRLVLPEVSGLSPIFVSGINNDGWVAGFVGVPGTTTHAVVWKPVGKGYQAIDLGTLPGKTISTAAGIDNRGRVVGWSTTQDFPPSGAPFVWTESGGLVDLTMQGFPADQPMAISPGGMVGTVDLRYRLGDPASVVVLPPAPQGLVIGADGFAINNAGDEARFLVDPPENLLYLFRFHHEGEGSWQQISSLATGHLSVARIGSINAGGDLTATVRGSGMVADGPDGLAYPLAPLVSPAYGGGDIANVGTMNSNGQILANMIIGRSSQRTVRLVPTEACTTNCVRVVRMTMTGTGPARCDVGENRVLAKLKVETELGGALPGVRISGRFLDDYWLDEPVVGTTNGRGIVKFRHRGPPCVGAVAFIVTDAALAGRTFDRTTGELADYVIPLS